MKLINNILLLFLILLSIIIPYFRHIVIYNIIPLFFLVFVIFILTEKYKFEKILILSLFFIALIHLYNFITVGVNFQFDSIEYLNYAKSFALGNGFANSSNRPPLYSLFSGLLIFLGGPSGSLIVFIQHIFIILDSFLVYLICKRIGWDELTSVLVMILLGINSLIIQTTSFIMTEVMFMSFVLVCVLMFIELYRKPSMLMAVLVGAISALTSHIRQMIFPLLFINYFLVVIRWKRKGFLIVLVSFFIYELCLMPWSLRNYINDGEYGISSQFGVNIYTKARSFNLENKNGKEYLKISKILENINKNLGLFLIENRIAPEDNWILNKVPHILIDSLIENHNYSYVTAQNLLKNIACEGFVAHKFEYLLSVKKSFVTMLFEHHEMYPGIETVIPDGKFYNNIIVKRILTGIVYIPSLLLLFFPLIAIRKRNYLDWIPFVIVLLMYLLTSMVQVGFTRYTIPWEPFKIMCGGYVIVELYRLIMKFYLNNFKFL